MSCFDISAHIHGLVPSMPNPPSFLPTEILQLFTRDHSTHRVKFPLLQPHTSKLIHCSQYSDSHNNKGVTLRQMHSSTHTLQSMWVCDGAAVLRLWTVECSLCHRVKHLRKTQLKSIWTLKVIEFGHRAGSPVSVYG